MFSKTTNSSFLTRKLEPYLEENKIWRLYFVGLSLDLCLGSTIRSASDLAVADYVDEEGKVFESGQGHIAIALSSSAGSSASERKYKAEEMDADRAS